MPLVPKLVPASVMAALFALRVKRKSERNHCPASLVPSMIFPLIEPPLVETRLVLPAWPSVILFVAIVKVTGRSVPPGAATKIPVRVSTPSLKPSLSESASKGSVPVSSADT